MDDLIVRHLQGKSTEIEARQLQRWRDESPENELDYQALVRLWAGMEEVGRRRVSSTPSGDALLEVAEARGRRAHARERARAVTRSPLTHVGLAAAAVAVLFFLASPDEDDVGEPWPGLTPTAVLPGSGNTTTISLSDGSVVRVQDRTQVDFPEGARDREVTLDGRAFFAVAEHARSFVVRTTLGEVEVRGTRFEVRTTPQEMRIVVVEGDVLARRGTTRLSVGAGEVAFLGPGREARVVTGEDVWSHLDWGDGLLLFQATPLSDAADQISRHFRRDVILSEPSVGGRRITAWFQDESFEEVVNTICVVAGLPCEIGADSATIGG